MEHECDELGINLLQFVFNISQKEWFRELFLLQCLISMHKISEHAQISSPSVKFEWLQIQDCSAWST